MRVKCCVSAIITLIGGVHDVWGIISFIEGGVKSE
jgi:hypothetical protein